jgi:phosphofructokinase-like protein
MIDIDKKASRRLGLMTGGGDAPGLNAVIRAVVKAAVSVNIDVVGLEDAFDGLAHPEHARVLTLRDVSGIHRLGGTILGTTNRGNPLARRPMPGADAAAYAACAMEGFRQLRLMAIIAIGGDGTLAIAADLDARGLPTIGVPKTIDHDLVGTATTIGFDSAVAFATEAIDRLHATADAHHRVMVVEVMGRYTGWIGLHAGIAGGADVVLIPEIPFHIEKVADRLLEREQCGARCSIVVVSEGACPVGGSRAVAAASTMGREERLGGIAERVACQLQGITGRDVRFDVLGHLQRGGTPTHFDRVTAARFGAFAVEIADRGEFGVMVALQPPGLVTVPLRDVAGRTHAVAADDDLIRTARHIGICFGD